MRLIIIAAALALASLTTFPALWASSSAEAEECSGENCLPEADKGEAGGHDCGRKEQTIS